MASICHCKKSKFMRNGVKDLRKELITRVKWQVNQMYRKEYKEIDAKWGWICIQEFSAK